MLIGALVDWGKTEGIRENWTKSDSIVQPVNPLTNQQYSFLTVQPINHLTIKLHMYYPYFIAYMAAGFAISILVFFWALNNGQFKDQQRARFIPLQDDLESAPIKASRRARIEIFALFMLASIGLIMSAAVVAFALYKAIR
jgi:nitrogen fixation-related uncharacterized protein